MADDIKSKVAVLEAKQDLMISKLDDQSDLIKDQSKVLAEHGRILCRQEEILDRQEQTLESQHKSLEQHMRRTAAAEDGIYNIRLQTSAMLELADEIKKRVEPLEKEATKKQAVREFTWSVIKWSTGAITLFAGAYSLFELFTK